MDRMIDMFRAYLDMDLEGASCEYVRETLESLGATKEDLEYLGVPVFEDE